MNMSTDDRPSRLRPGRLAPWAVLLIVLVVGIRVGLIVQYTHRQSQAIAELSRRQFVQASDRRGLPIRGDVPDWREEIPGADYFFIVEQLELDEASDEDGKSISQLTELRELALRDRSGVALSPAGLEFLQSMPNLESLDIQIGDHRSRQRTDDRILEQVGKLDHLKELVIDLGPSVTPGGLAQLANLRELENLILRGGGNSPLASLDGLGGLKKLKTLWLSRFPALTGAGLRSIADLPALRALQLHRCDRVSIADLPPFGALERIEFLGDQPVSDADLAHLATFRGLRHVEFVCPRGGGLSDEGLERLGRLPHLESLRVAGPGDSPITPAAIGNLQRAKPGLQFQSF